MKQLTFAAAIFLAVLATSCGADSTEAGSTDSTAVCADSTNCCPDSANMPIPVDTNRESAEPSTGPTE